MILPLAFPHIFFANKQGPITMY